jgi:hypothetical protein
VNDEARPDDQLTPSEERLLSLLLLFSADRPEADASLTDSVLRTVRWQLLVRGFARTMASLASAVGEGLGILLGIRTGPRKG